MRRPSPDDSAAWTDLSALSLDELEAEAERLERAAARRRAGRARRALLWQAPVLALAAVLLLVWGRLPGSDASASAVATPPSAATRPVISLSQAHLDAPARPGAPAYAYVTIRNEGGVADRLVNATTPWAAAVAVQGTGGSPWLTIPPHSTVTLRATAARLALTHLKRTPRPGDTVQIDLAFATSGTVYTFSPVGPASSLTVHAVMEAMKHMDELPPANGD
ncbi:copper chaperone PCu(A)C [Phaeacidiphilus oryzae]|uniref:copper chaperone PCu(A)C n=1 Tax=Phaeacidiphilus oryzae TaxID=348818 RepID=UPI00055B685F|nr:copper chaperone PCu(A)C [Phaeacidiphilus oryzae]